MGLLCLTRPKLQHCTRDARLNKVDMSRQALHKPSMAESLGQSHFCLPES